MSNGTVLVTSCQRCKPMKTFSTFQISAFKTKSCYCERSSKSRRRLHTAFVSFDLKHPIILPHTSHSTNLIVLHCHCITGHGEANMTLNQLLYNVIGFYEV